jgi:hypothetical protein
MPLGYDFGVSFAVVILESEDWDNVSSEYESIEHSTDGSTKDGVTFIGIAGSTPAYKCVCKNERDTYSSCQTARLRSEH